MPILLAVGTFLYLVLIIWTRDWPTRREVSLGLIVLRKPTSRYHWIGLACCIAGIVVIAL